MRAADAFFYIVHVTPIGGAGVVTIMDYATPHEGESREDCVRREAAEAGWEIKELWVSRA